METTLKSFTLQIDEAHLTKVVENAVLRALSNASAARYNKKEAAKYLKISSVKLWTLEREGRIKPIHEDGGRSWYTRQELDRYAEGRRS
jgi:hypothetical protein